MTFNYFNPVPDRIRVHSDADQDLRLNPANGTVAGVDSVLAYNAGDANFGINPNITARPIPTVLPAQPRRCFTLLISAAIFS